MLPVEIIKEYLSYDPDSGVFAWVKRSSDKSAIGSRAGRARAPGGYRQITLKGVTMYEHRVAYVYVHGSIPSGRSIDHINGLKGDNRIANLRVATGSQNLANLSAKKDNTSGCKNVHWCATKKRWIAKVKKNGRSVYVGSFQDFDKATSAAMDARVAAFGEFASQLGCDAVGAV